MASIRTHAERVDGGYVVNGAKTFITGGVRADVLVTRGARPQPEGGHQGISFLIIERGDGRHARAPCASSAGTPRTPPRSRFDDVFVPEENLLGSEHGGFYLIMANFQWERLLMALGAVGAMQACFEQTLDFVPRAAGARGSQSVRHRLAEIAVTIEAGRDVTYAALRRYVGRRRTPCAR